MEPLTPPGLVLTNRPLDTCPLGGGKVVERMARVELVGTGAPAEWMALGWSQRAACWYMHIEDVLEWCEEEGVPLYAAGPFRVDGAEQEVGVYVSGSDHLVPWAPFAAGVARAADRARAPAPTGEAVRALPELPEAWELAVAEVGYTDTDDGIVGLHVALVVDPGGHARKTQLREGAFTLEGLAALVRSATAASPEIGLTAGRPRTLRCEDPELAKPLADALAATGIRVAGEATPAARALLASMHKSDDERPALPPILGAPSDEDLARFFQAARAFYAARPWERLRGDLFLAVQVLGEGKPGPWRYASVMGQAGEELGLSVFGDWLDACALIAQASAPPFGPRPDRFDPMDGVTLLPLAALHRDDRQRVERAEPRPTAFGQYALPKRVSRRGFSRSTIPLAEWTALLSALPDVLARRRAHAVTSIKATVEAEGLRLALRYPARGTEALSGDEPGVRLVVEGRGRAGRQYADILPKGRRLVVEGPADTRAYDLGKAVNRAFDEAPGLWGWVREIGAGDRALWFGRNYATDPGPTLDHLASLKRVWIEVGEERYPVRVGRLPPGEGGALRAVVE